jgi:hypothetical protein
VRRFYLLNALVLLPIALAGCNPFNKFAAARQDVVIPPTVAITPPVGSIPLGEGPGGLVVSPTPPGAVLVPALNRDLVWDQVVDIVDDYFKIEHEERVKLIGNTLIEGRIDTYPITGATLMEPWHGDSVGFYNRLESTLQSIRRRADVRVIPVEQGFLIDVVVMKDLEVVDRPIKASAGAATFRYDDSLNRDTEFDPDQNRLPGDPARPIGPRAANSGWKYLGRDTDLEQVILGRIAERLGGVAAPSAGPGVGTATVVTPSPNPQFIGPGFQALPAPTPAAGLPNAGTVPSNVGTLPPAGIVIPPRTELPAPGVGALPPGGVILPQPLPRP